MDDRRFDQLTRTLARGTSRRGLLRGLAAVVAGGLTGVRVADDAAAQRVPRQAAGASCARSIDCASFQCVDGVCCDDPCTGQCESCASGTCTPVVGAPVGDRPACPGSGPCRAACDGVDGRVCAAWPGGETACGASTCADGWLTSHACGGNGACVPTTTSCAPYGCDGSGTACASGCTSHDQCPGAAHCAAGVCVGDKPLGAACADGAECVHGFCANGVCCAEACMGECQACGADGFCGQAADDAECAGGRCCEGACVDLSSDVAHCGGCDNACLGAVCQAAVCAGGECATAPLPDGTACADGNACTERDVCQGGVCTGEPIACDDGLACTTDSCDPATGCVNAVQPGFCLIAGACYAAGARNPATPCQICDPSQVIDAWTNRPLGAACDDMTRCNGREACDGQGACQPGIPVTCPPSQPCQEDGICDPDSGECTYELKMGTVCRAAATPCEEDAVCTGTDPGCPTNPIAVGRECDDGNPCTDFDACQEDGTCAGTPKDCEDGLTCTVGACGPDGACVQSVQTGSCAIDGACYRDGDRDPATPCRHCDPTQATDAWTNLPQGAPCADADRCDGEEACDGQGQCLAGAPVTCPNVQPCQEAGFCNPNTGACVYLPKRPGTVCRAAATPCEFDALCNGVDAGCPANVPKPNDISCDDGDLCVSSTCQDGVCVARETVSCEPFISCNRLLGCNPETGRCLYEPADEGVACGGPTPACQVRVCRAGDCVLEPISGFCLIDGACYADGDRDPAVSCQSCDPSREPFAWSVDEGNCSIDGVCYGTEDRNPFNACQMCDAVRDTNDWSPAPVGTYCVIDSTCYQAGIPNPNHPCLVCDPDRADDVWSPVADTCFIDGVCRATGEVSANSLCVICDPAVSQTEWLVRPDGIPCGSPCLSDGRCQSGVCVGEVTEGYCAIGTACYGRFELDPHDSCLVCNPANSQTRFSPPPAGVICNINGVCYAAGEAHPSAPCLVCEPALVADAWSLHPEACAIANVCYAAGDADPTSKCRICAPERSQTSWSPMPDRTPCGLACFPDGRCSSGICISEVATEICDIDGVCHATGDRRPGDACQVCDPARAQTAWSVALLGTVCVIDGACYAPGDRNPAVSCQSCDPSRAPFAWSVDDDACLIAGACYRTGDRNPLNPCQMCDAAHHTGDWWLSPVGTYCVIGPTCYAEGAVNPALPCLVCDPARDDDAWSPFADACLIDGACYEIGEENPAAPCLICHPFRDRFAWSTLDESCFVDGACHRAGEAHPTNPCWLCDPVSQHNAWATRPNGTPCGSACLSGQCSFGDCRGEVAAGFCAIGGACVASGMSHPDEPCLVCDPARGTIDWSRVADGTPCDAGCIAGGVCGSGICQGGAPAPDSCLINGRCYNAGAPNPAMAPPCEVCDPAISQTAWTRLADGTPCGDPTDLCVFNPTCQAGVCRPEFETTCQQPADLPLCQENVCDPARGGCVQVGIHLRDDRKRCEYCPRCEAGACLDKRPVSCGGLCFFCDEATSTCRQHPAGADCTTNCAEPHSCTDVGLCLPDLTPGRNTCIDSDDECADLVCDVASGQCVVQTGADNGKLCSGGCHNCRDGLCVWSEELFDRPCDPTDPCKVCRSFVCVGDSFRCGYCAERPCGSCAACNSESGACESCEPCCDGVCCAENRECCHNLCCPIGKTCCGTAANYEFEHQGVCCGPDEACCPVFGIEHGGAMCCQPHQTCGIFGCE